MRKTSVLAMVIICWTACNNGPVKQPGTITKKNAVEQDFVFEKHVDSVVTNGEQIQYHKNGVIEMRGLMKNNKRDGLWKSWYENGLPWSETTFKEGIKDGKTTTWYDNGNRRYEGFYTNNKESGRWTFWKEDGTIADSKNYDLR